ncbi:uncharacterized protein LOC110101382 [Dendrobium catenatum]|uniref:uncharacterized protein LOC110101382 n=1 Tax=Dendrobium catenatum TaxID=906689 RepID=UPI0010A0174F|nr:uncharacterized protein LOC110101382 [Dendrobium catenatum]
MVWSRGVWFLLGKPFVLQKWHPKKKDFKTVPIWVKIHDLPLACWNSEGISWIASKIGVPIAVDSLTEQKTRLTFACVCVLVDCNATYPEEIKVSLDGDVVCLKVQYEWRPFPCAHYKSLTHFSSSCPSKPDVVTNVENVNARQNRGRSFSRKPNSRHLSKNPNFARPPASQDSPPRASNVVSGDSLIDQGVSNMIGQPLLYQPHSPPPFKLGSPAKDLPLVPPPIVYQSGKVDDGLGIPNLNSPNEATSSSTSIPQSNSNLSTKIVKVTSAGDFAQKEIISPNKFDALHIEDDIPLQSNVNAESEGISATDKEEGGGESLFKEVCKAKNPQPSAASKKTAKGKQRLVESFNLDLVCVLENRIQNKSLNDQFFVTAHSLFPNESSCHNFDLSLSGRIWVKWDPLKLSFTPNFITSQMINGIVTGSSFTTFQIIAVYASNSSQVRKSLWEDICSVAPDCHTPWVIIGDFNCCRYASEKIGGIFLFKNYWTKLDDYWSLLIETLYLPSTGNPLGHLCNLFRTLKKEIKAKSRASSFCVSRHIELLHNNQQALLASLHSDPFNFSLNRSYKENNIKLAEFMSLQASWIIQRAKVNWLKYDEDDLKFLYAKIRIRMGSNKSVVNLLSSNPQSSRADMISFIIHYFQELYNPSPPSNMNMDIFPVGNILSDEYVSSLNSYVTDGDIKSAVFSGSSKSAPGLDGLNFHFYKSGWHILGPTVCRAIRSFFIKGFLPKGVKSTALAIVPKHKNASSISDYRPIALCNVLYKIIAKILAAKLKPVMNWIVKDNQAGFVNSRVSTDNILLANDILYHAGKRGGDNIFCAKLDIKKAFDSVSRQFLLARLAQKGFPSFFISWIKACITDVNFSILLNGALEGYFPTSAGLRQGCPLSPYLFCIVMDAFSNLLEGRGFKGITNGNFSLNHLLYADDVLIFGEATTENCLIRANAITDFANSSGLFINYEKYSIMFPNHLRNQLEVCQMLSIHSIVNKITYLGIPLSFYRLNVADFMPLLDSLNKKLNGWKANLLSFAGRLQYLKFTIQNTISYWIRGSFIPKSVHKVFKKVSSRFLFFGEVNSVKKLHKMYNHDSPLARWLLAKYRSPWKPTHSSSSKMWESICKTAETVKSCFHFTIFPKCPISLKWDHWCLNSTLGSIAGLADNAGLPDIRLADIISENGWEISGVINPMLHQYFERVNIVNGVGLCLLWYNRNCFRLNSFIKEFYTDYPDCHWYKMVWHKKHILKHSVFVWLALKDGLKTAAALRIRQIFVPISCSLCHLCAESVAHLFFECTYSFYILKCLIPGVEIFLLRPSILQLFDWMNGEFGSNANTLNFYKLAVGCIIYFTWKERNRRRFGGNSNCSTTVLLNIKRVIFEKLVLSGSAIFGRIWPGGVALLLRTMMKLQNVARRILPLGWPSGNQGFSSFFYCHCRWFVLMVAGL